MAIYNYEEAFGAGDQTTRQMRNAISQWFQLYYGTQTKGDPCQRLAYTIVNKLVRTIFGEYQVSAEHPALRAMLMELNEASRQAVEMSLVGGECYLKPCLGEAGISFALIPRTNVLVFGRDAGGRITDMGTVEQSVRGKFYYTLLERRSVDEQGYLTIQNKLFRSGNSQSIGMQVNLTEHPAYEQLPEQYRYETPIGSVGLVQIRTPMLNCVDGSADGVSVYAAAVELIARIDENEEQFRGEFTRGQSRIIASRDLLKDDGSGSLNLTDHLFVGLDEDPEQVGITVFSPQLRHTSYLERKKEYLRNVESMIGLKRGMLSDTNLDNRTATEISASAGDFNLTIIDFQRMWEKAVRDAVALCRVLAGIYGVDMPAEPGNVNIDWGNGVLYDEDKTWQSYQQMVAEGLLKPEIALGWRFNMPTETEQQQQHIRQKLMPHTPTDPE